MPMYIVNYLTGIYLQNFIFLTVTYFGPLTCSVITTTRKFFTILGSVLIFRHPLTTLQWTGTLLVFAGLSLDSAFGKAGKHKPASQKDADVDVTTDKMMNNGLMFQADEHQQKRDKVKPL